jgi:hypothetical protein
VASIGRFDMDHFAPHPPGYPVYVALLRAASWAFADPVAAANAVAVACGLGAVVFLGLAAARVFGRERAVWIVVFVSAAPLVWRTSTAVGSEAPALLLACAMVYGGARSDRATPWWIGLGLGLGLGVRLSWAPLFVALVALAPRGTRMGAALVAAGATALWLVPFLGWVGPAHLASLVRAQATGHFHVWGGSAISEPGLGRIAWFLRDVFVDGLGGGKDPLGIVTLLLLALLGVLGLVAWRWAGAPHGWTVLLVAPYALWIALGQNLRQQPRHALPLVVALAALLGLAATSSARARAVGLVLLSFVALRTLSDAYARRTIPPPGEQLVAFAGANGPGAAVFGGPSARFFERAPNVVGRTVSTLGEAHLTLGRLSSLPSRVFVTSELDGVGTSGAALVHVATLCRPPRIDRRAPCLDVYEWPGALPRH